MDAKVTQETRFLPALADAIAGWFPELGGRSLAVSEVSITKDNVPTLPLAMVAFIRSVADPPSRSRAEMFEVVDTFIVDFWLEPARYKKTNGTETPFWSYYDYEAIRDTLLTNLSRWDAPGGERIAYRGLTIEAEPLAVTLTFTFMATFRWCPSNRLTDLGDPFTVGFRLCTPTDYCEPDDCRYPDDPCQDTTPEPPEDDLEEAPADGKLYVRQSGQWVVMPPMPGAAFQFRADMGTTASDPGSGKLRWNNAVQQDATELYVDRLTQDSFDISLVLLVSQADDRLAIQDKSFALDNQIWKITGPVVEMPDWFKVPVQFVSAQGNSNFVGNQQISVLVR